MIGTDQPNAADFQILSSVRVLLDFQALPSFEERPSARAARTCSRTGKGNALLPDRGRRLTTP